MTVLGAIFLGVFILAVGIDGRRGLIFGVALSVPFYASAMFVVGDFAVPPFYVGIIFYVALSIMRLGVRSVFGRNASPKMLIVYCLLITVSAPYLFGNVEVLAAGAGLDARASGLEPLTLSLSNLAQFAYLTLNLLLLQLNESDKYVNVRSVSVALGLGVAVGVFAYLLGPAWPQDLFDNNPRNFYVDSLERSRAPFAEPSQMGGFAIAALPFFAIAVLRAKKWPQLLSAMVLAVSSAFLLIISYSGTAIVGGALGAIVVLMVGIVRVVGTRVRIAPVAMLGGIAAVGAGIALLPMTVNVLARVISEKQGTTSEVSRGYADAHGFNLLLQTDLLGAGLGSNRTSSMLSLLLSNIGIIGFGLFMVIVFTAARRSLSDSSRWSSLVALTFLLSASFLSLANFASPVLWILLVACWPNRGSSAGNNKAAVHTRIQSTTP